MIRSRFCKVVARAGIQIEPIEFLQLLDALETLGAKRTFAVEGMQHDPFQEIAERQVVKLPERFEHFQDSLFHAHAGLHALHDELFFLCHSDGFLHWYQCTKVPESRQVAAVIAADEAPDANKQRRAPPFTPRS